MAHRELRKKAINLRLQGYSYREVRKKIHVSKSTLSSWLSNYPLTKAQFMLISQKRRKNKLLQIERNRLTLKMKKEKRLKKQYSKQKRAFLPLNDKEILLAGLFLYWGEGNKRIDGPVSLNNTDPYVLSFTLNWLTRGLGIPKEKIKIDLHLYSDMDIEIEKEFWSKQLNISLKQFRKPYIKKNSRRKIDQKGYGHGTCGLVVHNVLLKEKVMMGIKAIADYYSSKLSL